MWECLPLSCVQLPRPTYLCLSSVWHLPYFSPVWRLRLLRFFFHSYIIRRYQACEEPASWGKHNNLGEFLITLERHLIRVEVHLEGLLNRRVLRALSQLAWLVHGGHSLSIESTHPTGFGSRLAASKIKRKVASRYWKSSAPIRDTS